MPNVEDRKLTPKQNYLRMLRGEQPEWLPMGFPPMDSGEAPAQMMFVSSLMHDPHHSGPGGDNKDLWGVQWVGSESTAGALLPEPNNFLLDDITKWHDVVKGPDLSDVDWEMVCKRDLDNLIKMFHIDREQTAINMNLYVGAFQQVMALMGFTEGMIAMYEEPEETFEMMKYINDVHVEIGKQCMPYIQPDMIQFMDDSCSANSPFISEQLFRELCVPCYKHQAEELTWPYDLPSEMHNCGMAGKFIGIVHEECGINGWDPAQTMNDLDAFKAKWGNKIAIVGGWEPRGRLLEDDVTDEEIVASVKDAIDRLGPGGGYAFSGMFGLDPTDVESIRKTGVVNAFAYDYCNHFYD